MRLIDFVKYAFGYHTSGFDYASNAPYIYFASTLLKNIDGSAIIDVPAYLYSCLDRAAILKAVREDRIIRTGLPAREYSPWEGSSLSSALAGCYGYNIRKCIKDNTEVFYAGAGAMFDADFNPLLLPFVRLEVTMIPCAEDFDIPIAARPGLWVSPTIIAATSGIYKSVKNNIVIPSCNTRVRIQTIDGIHGVNELLKVECSDDTILCYKSVELGIWRNPSDIMDLVIDAAINSI